MSRRVSAVVPVALPAPTSWSKRQPLGGHPRLESSKRQQAQLGLRDSAGRTAVGSGPPSPNLRGGSGSVPGQYSPAGAVRSPWGSSSWLTNAASSSGRAPTSPSSMPRYVDQAAVVVG